ncbi:MAG: DUF4900 domain-containing protein [candidate division Zixibacteria bacterium]|nr:DUF4900 domain-containing protein [candidate division Zixibacteria bacterium]
MKTLNNQNGIALMVAMGLLLMVSLIGLAAVLTSDTETDISVNKKNDAKAFYTAEGGLEWAHGDIKEAVNAIDTIVIPRDTALTFLDDPMRLLTKYIPNFTNRFPQDSFKAAAYMGGRESYKLKYSIAPFDTTVTSRGFVFTYRYTITSQGRYSDPVLGFNEKNNIIAGTFSVNLNRASFAQYALFRHMTTDTAGNQLFFRNAEKFGGPVHTNGKPGFSASPIFNGPFTSAWTSYGTSAQINNADPQFNGGSQWGMGSIGLPTNAYSQQRAAFDDTDPTNTSSPNNSDIRNGLGLGGGGAIPTGVYLANNGTINATAGIYVQGDVTSLQLWVGADSSQHYRFNQGGTITDIVVDYGSNQTIFNGTTYTGTPNGALFVSGSVNSLGGTSRTDPSIAAGTQLTLAVTGNVRITNDIIYQGVVFKDADGNVVTDPTGANVTPEIDLNATNMLGIFSSAGNVRIAAGAPDNLNLHASIMASGVNKGFGAEDLLNTHGNLKLLGGLTEYQAKLLGIIDADGNLTGGYARKLFYDNRFATNFAPPFFPTRNAYLTSMGAFNTSRWAAQ